MPLEDEFCDILKKARMGQELTVAEVARKSGLPPGEIQALERGGRLPTRSEVEAIATALGLRAGPLAEIALDGWMPAPTPACVQDGMSVVETVLGDIGGYAVKGYVLFDAEAREAILVDTGYNPRGMLQVLDRQGLRPVGVCLTHGHVDHAGGLERILERWRVPVYLGEADLDLLAWRPPRELLIQMTQADNKRTIKAGRLAGSAIKSSMERMRSALSGTLCLPAPSVARTPSRSTRSTWNRSGASCSHSPATRSCFRAMVRPRRSIRNGRIIRLDSAAQTAELK